VTHREAGHWRRDGGLTEALVDERFAEYSARYIH
jgi:hypothetical protein